MNMSGHYKRLSKVKSTIDTSAPKSLSTNTRKRDSVNRSLAMGLDVPKTSRPPSSSRPQSARPQTARPYSSRLSFHSARSNQTRPKSSCHTPQGWDSSNAELGFSVEPLESQLEALQLLKSEDYDEDNDEESKDAVQPEKDALADRLILMYGGGDAGNTQQDSFDESRRFPTSQRTDARDPMRSQRSNPSHRSQQQPPHRTSTRSTRSGDVLESRSHVFTATEK